MQAEASAEVARTEAQDAAAVAVADQEKTDADLLAEHDLPDPDTMKPGDDFSMFMRQAVPDRLRRRALRKLWLTNPVLANIDGLVEYGEDYTDAATVVENLQTAYQVGKGMTKHVEEMARIAEEEERQLKQGDEHPTDETAATTEIEEPVEMAAIPPVEKAASLGMTVEPVIDTLEFEIPEPDITASLPRRRMRFEYAE